MVIRVRPSELFRGEARNGTACAIALAVRRAAPHVYWRGTGILETNYLEPRLVRHVAHTTFGKVVVIFNDVFPKLRAVLLPFLWLPVIKAPEDTFAIPPDRIITVPEPEREAWPIPREQPVIAPAIELPVEEPVRVPA